MALSNSEIVQGELDVIDTDGTFTQFSKSAVEAFVQRATRVELARFENRILVRLYENNVLRNAENFLAFQVDAVQSALQVEGDGTLLYDVPLDSLHNPSAGRYEFAPTAGDLLAALAVRLTLRVQFQNPATMSNPAALVAIQLVYFAGANADDALYSQPHGIRVLTLGEEGWVKEVDI